MHIKNLRAYDNGGHGLYVDGVDVNAEGLDLRRNKAGGAYVKNARVRATDVHIEE